jgi:RPA family protein
VYLDLASAIGTRGAAVDVEAVVTATAGLLDVAGPTIVVDDGTAAAAVIVPVGTVAPGVGMRVHVIGKIGRWEGGPTVLASQVVAEGQLEATVPRPVAGSLDASLEWQLIQICGRIDGYTPAGSRWRLDVLVDGHTVVVLGEPAAAIAVTKASVGRMVVVVGIVRRSTSDSSAFQLLPRMAVDFRLGPALDALDSVASTGKNQAGASPRSGAPSSGLKARSVEIGSLSGYVGRSVTVAGLVTGTADGAATIDDGTGQVRVGGAAATDALANLEPGDAVEVTGSVREDDQGLIIEADPASIVDLPGDSGDGSAAAGAVDRVVAGVPATKAVSMAPQASIRRASPGATPPDGPTLLLVTLLTLLAVAGSLTLARRRHGLARIVHRSSEGPARRLAAALARWPWLGREQGQ